jgi:ADP-heptose:LPS heptosyltransferase
MNRTLDRILIVKLADIGDAVLALPAIQAVRNHLPTAQIDVLTTPAGALVFERSPAVDHVVTLKKQQFDRISGLVSPRAILDIARLTRDLRSARYDAVILLHHLTTGFGAMKFRALVAATGSDIIAGLDNGQGSFLTHRATDWGFGELSEWAYGLEIVRALGIPAERSRPDVQFDPEARANAGRLLVDRGVSEDYIVFHVEVGDFSPARAWPDNHLAELAIQLNQRYEKPIVLVGVDPDRPGLARISDGEEIVNLCGETTFDELCVVIEGASLVIGADSSVAHLAAAFDRPNVTLFGPSNPEAWRPFGSEIVRTGSSDQPKSRQLVLTRKLSCSPCMYRGFSLGRPQGCRSRQCLTGLTPHQVSGVIETMNIERSGSARIAEQPTPDA